MTEFKVWEAPSESSEKWTPGTPTKNLNFALQSSAWEELRRDPTVQKYIADTIEERVETEVQKRLDKRTQELENELTLKIHEQLCEQGRDQGRQQARAQMQPLIEKFSHLTEQILAEKNQVLFDHCELWADALRSTLNKLMISDSGISSEKLVVWLRSQVTELLRNAKVRVRVCSDSGVNASELMKIASNVNWEVVADASLSITDLVLELCDGEVFYSGEKSMATWNKIFEHLFSEEKK